MGQNHPEISSSFNLDDYLAVREAQMQVGSTENAVWYDRDSLIFRDGHTHFERKEYQREGVELAYPAFREAFPDF
jgi:hypothetical protein